MPYKDKNRVRAKCNAYYQKHKETWAKYGFRSRYGLTPEQIEVQRKKQNNACAICYKTKKLVVDHCHTTSKFRGLLCANCNVLLGMAQDNQAILNSAVEYLKNVEL